MRYIPEDSGQQTVCDILLSLILGRAKISVYFNKLWLRVTNVKQKQTAISDVAQPQLAMAKEV